MWTALAFAAVFLNGFVAGVCVTEGCEAYLEHYRQGHPQ